MGRRHFAKFMALLLVAANGFPAQAQAQAQAQTAAEAQHVRLIGALLAQRDAAMVRERRLADDRQLALIDDHEARIRRLSGERLRFEAQARAARSEGARERRRRAIVETELTTARTEFASLAADLARRDAQWSVEREAFRAETQQLVAQASPAKLAALERFADGDRVGAYPIIAELTQAEVRAGMSAAGVRMAARVRQQAELREIMRANGEATAADALALWEQANLLDPADFWT